MRGFVEEDDSSDDGTVGRVSAHLEGRDPESSSSGGLGVCRKP